MFGGNRNKDDDSNSKSLPLFDMLLGSKKDGEESDASAQEEEMEEVVDKGDVFYQPKGPTTEEEVEKLKREKISSMDMLKRKLSDNYDEEFFEEDSSSDNDDSFLSFIDELKADDDFKSLDDDDFQSLDSYSDDTFTNDDSDESLLGSESLFYDDSKTNNLNFSNEYNGSEFEKEKKDILAQLRNLDNEPKNSRPKSSEIDKKVEIEIPEEDIKTKLLQMDKSDSEQLPLDEEKYEPINYQELDVMSETKETVNDEVSEEEISKSRILLGHVEKGLDPAGIMESITTGDEERDMNLPELPKETFTEGPIEEDEEKSETSSMDSLYGEFYNSKPLTISDDPIEPLNYTEDSPLIETINDRIVKEEVTLSNINDVEELLEDEFLDEEKLSSLDYEDISKKPLTDDDFEELADFVTKGNDVIDEALDIVEEIASSKDSVLEKEENPIVTEELNHQIKESGELEELYQEANKVEDAKELEKLRKAIEKSKATEVFTEKIEPMEQEHILQTIAEIEKNIEEDEKKNELRNDLDNKLRKGLEVDIKLDLEEKTEANTNSEKISQPESLVEINEKLKLDLENSRKLESALEKIYEQDLVLEEEYRSELLTDNKKEISNVDKNISNQVLDNKFSEDVMRKYGLLPMTNIKPIINKTEETSNEPEMESKEAGRLSKKIIREYGLLIDKDSEYDKAFISNAVKRIKIVEEESKKSRDKIEEAKEKSTYKDKLNTKNSIIHDINSDLKDKLINKIIIKEAEQVEGNNEVEKIKRINRENIKFNKEDYFKDNEESMKFLEFYCKDKGYYFYKKNNDLLNFLSKDDVHFRRYKIIENDIFLINTAVSKVIYDDASGLMDSNADVALKLFEQVCKYSVDVSISNKSLEKVVEILGELEKKKVSSVIEKMFKKEQKLLFLIYDY